MSPGAAGARSASARQLGATARGVVLMLLRDFSKPVLIANLIAWPFAFFAGKLYFNLFTQRATMTPWPFPGEPRDHARHRLARRQRAGAPGGGGEARQRAARGLSVSGAHGGDEGLELVGIEAAIGAHPGAQVHPKRVNPSDRFADVRRGQATREEYRQRAAPNELCAHRPIVRPPRSTVFRRGQRRSPRVEQEGMHVRRVSGDQLQRGFILDMDDLHAASRRQELRQLFGFVGGQMRDDLHGGSARRQHASRDALGRVFRGEEKRRHRRRDARDDRGHFPVIDGAAGRGHPAHPEEPHGIRSGANGELRLLEGAQAADLDPGAHDGDGTRSGLCSLRGPGHDVPLTRGKRNENFFGASGGGVSGAQRRLCRPARRYHSGDDRVGLAGRGCAEGRCPVLTRWPSSLRSARPSSRRFHPTSLDAFPKKDTLPVVIWGNGGCAVDNPKYDGFLSTIASHGFLVITTTGAPQPAGAPRQQSTADDLKAAVDWAERESTRAGSPLNGKIDTKKVAVMGQSCGGALALTLGGDPRVGTIGVFNSGMQAAGSAPNPTFPGAEGAEETAWAGAADQWPRARLHDGALQGDV